MDEGTAAAADSAATLRRLGMALRVSRALHAAAALDLAGLLAGGPRDSASLAAATGTHPGALRRLMRALSAFGVFAEPAPGLFAPTPVSDRLRADAPDSMRAAVLFLAGDTRWRCWGDLLGSLRTGEPAADRVLGMGVFEHYAAHPEEAEVHERAMEGITAAVSRAVLAAYDFSRFRCAMDVGGGNARFLADILAAAPALSGVLFDLPHVAPAARALLEARGLAARCRVEGGSFFEGVPRGADLHVLKQVLHDWDDPRAAAILRACRAALPAGGTLLVVERVMPERAEPGPGADKFLTDLEMLVMTGGMERTEGEFRALLAQGGFAPRRVVPTASVYALIEAVPA
jgi:O-methyltransferase